MTTDPLYAEVWNGERDSPILLTYMRIDTNGGVMRCQSCGSSEITVIGFTSGDGTTYRFCRYCEKSTWEAAGEKVATVHMLEIASTIEPGRRRTAA